MDKAIIKLRQDTDKAITAKLTAQEIIETIYPRVLTALDEAETVEQANEIRHQVETVVLYVNKKIPIETGERKKTLKRANKGNELFLLACRKAGIIWDMMEKHMGRPPGPDGESGQKLPLYTAQQAGFADRHDASRCAKVSRIHDEDFRTYKSECDANGRQYTLGGLVNVYDMMQSKTGEEDDGDDVQFRKGSPIDRMHGIHKKILGLLTDLYDDAEKDWSVETGHLEKAFGLVQKAIESAEGQKEKGN